jgi:hypothetical protein
MLEDELIIVYIITLADSEIYERIVIQNIGYFFESYNLR